MIRFEDPRPRRRPNLTPMIDVIFLLLVFFMLASRFGSDRALPLSFTGSGTAYSGPPRLVELTPTGLLLNGRSIAVEDIGTALAPLMQSPNDIIVLRPRDGTDLQALVTLMDRLAAAGLANLVLVE